MSTPDYLLLDTRTRTTSVPTLADDAYAACPSCGSELDSAWAEDGEADLAPADPDRGGCPYDAKLDGRREGMGTGESTCGNDSHGRGFSWGDYGPAVQRWERVIGRDAPAPTDDRGRLMPAFVEWMMGYPDRWVTGTDVSRTQALRMLGNAVVPQQARLAWTILTEQAAS